MLKKSVFIIAILFLFLFIFSSCIIVTPASNSKSRPSPTSKPAPAKDKILKGKFQVLVISKQIHFKDRSGVVYAISGLGKKDM